VDRVRRQFQYIELHQGLGPVDRLGDAWELEEVHRAQPLYKADNLARQMLARARRFPLQYFELARRGRIVHPVIEATPLQRVMDLAGTVRGDDNDRRMLRVYGADLRDRHLKVGEQLEEVGLERLVGAVELVDQQHRRVLADRLSKSLAGSPQARKVAILQPALTFEIVQISSAAAILPQVQEHVGL